jgi:hypothetical protein
MLTYRWVSVTPASTGDRVRFSRALIHFALLRSRTRHGACQTRPLRRGDSRGGEWRLVRYVKRVCGKSRDARVSVMSAKLCVGRCLTEAMFLEEAAEMSPLGTRNARRDRDIAVRQVDQLREICVLKISDRLLFCVPVARLD